MLYPWHLNNAIVFEYVIKHINAAVQDRLNDCDCFHVSDTKMVEQSLRQLGKIAKLSISWISWNIDMQVLVVLLDMKVTICTLCSDDLFVLEQTEHLRYPVTFVDDRFLEQVVQ